MTQIIEVKIYKLKDESVDEFNSLRRKVADRVSTYDGYHSSLTFRGADKENANVFLDYTVWDNMEAATNAAEAYLNDKELESFNDAVLEKVSSKRFVPDSEDAILKASDFDADSILESSIGGLIDGTSQKTLKVKNSLFDIVRKEKGLSKLTTATSPDANIAFCALSWESEQLVGEAMERVHELPEFTDYGTIVEVCDGMFFGLLKPVIY